MSEDRKSGSLGADLEHALNIFEQELAQVSPTGRRHTQPDEDAGNLDELRMYVIREAEALPRAVWPRPVCGHCDGERQVEAIRAHYAGGADSSPQFNTICRMCPQCSGTGLMLTSSATSDTPAFG